MRAVCVLLLCSACGSGASDSDATSGDASTCTTGCTEVAAFATEPIRSADLLFLVDNSHTMADEQAALTAGFGTLLNHAAQLPEPGSCTSHMPDMPGSGGAIAAAGRCACVAAAVSTIIAIAQDTIRVTLNIDRLTV